MGFGVILPMDHREPLIFNTTHITNHAIITMATFMGRIWMGVKAIDDLPICLPGSYLFSFSCGHVL